MRVLVIGCGSIGSRRARLLAEMGHEVMLFDADTNRAMAAYRAIDHPAVTASIFGNVWTGWGDQGDDEPGYDAAFICTPAHTHWGAAWEAMDAGIKGLFIEKPLATTMAGIPELVAECEKRGVVTMGACNIRWAYGDPRPADYFSAWTSGPLSGWRAGAAEAYRGNGIVLESAIHDIDLAAHWMGPITKVSAAGGEDGVTIRLEHGHPERCSYVVAEWGEDTEVARGLVSATGNTLKSRDPDTSDEMYRQEMAHFLDCVANGTATTNPIANAAVTLGWALKARDMTRKVAA